MAGYYKEQPQNITATPEEIDAWEALRREPGLRGRLARKGKHMKPSYVGGKRSFSYEDKDERMDADLGDDRGAFETRPDVIQSRSTAAGRGGDYNAHQNQQSGSGSSGPVASGPTEAEIRAKIAEEEATKKKKEEEEKAKKRELRREELHGEYGDYKGDYEDLRDRADYTKHRGELDTLKTESAGKYGGETGYESQISKMADRGGQVAGIGGKMETMAGEAMDTQKLMKDRGLYTGRLEQARKTGEKGKLAKLRRSMASAGSSPEEIARAEAEASGGAGAAGSGMRSDQLQGAMMAMQARQGQLGQAAQLRGMQAGMLGQAQNLGLQKIGAQANMYQQGLGNQQNLIGQNAQMLQGEIAQQAGLTGQMSGMTDAQMQDIVARQNASQEEKLAREGLLMQSQANQANAPRGPSQTQQLMNLVQTGAQAYGTYKMMAACIPESTKIDTPDGQVTIEDIKVGTMVKGYYGPETEVLQVHQYKEDPAPHRFYHIKFDNGGSVDCCDMHRIAGKRAKDYKVGDVASANRITSITRYNGVKRSYDLLTADGGYRMNNIQINSMIPEVAQGEVAEMNKIKLAA